jgi:DNA/RNA-binding domain of Phe-tRNA-synthetase-like protein
MLLTAGHDLDVLQLTLTLDASKGNESYQLMRGEEQILKAEDMFIRDEVGIISSIIYGPDKRTQITSNTKNVIFTVYAPDGIEKQTVIDHLEDIQEYVKLFSPESQAEILNT